MYDVTNAPRILYMRLVLVSVLAGISHPQLLDAAADEDVIGNDGGSNKEQASNDQHKQPACSERQRMSFPLLLEGHKVSRGQ